MMRTTITPNIVAEIYYLYLEGLLSQSQVASRLNIGETTVCYVLIGRHRLSTRDNVSRSISEGKKVRNAQTN